MIFINKNFKWKNRLFVLMSLRDIAQNALQQEWGNFPFANWNGICRVLQLQLVQFIKIHFLPHLESFMCKRKFENRFFKKNPIQPPNGVLSICKLLFPNGSYRNGVSRALWAVYTVAVHILILLSSISYTTNAYTFVCQDIIKAL